MEEQTVKLKDGREVLLRLLKSEDREKLLSMFTVMSDEALLWSNPPYDEEKIDRWMTGTSTGLSIVAQFDERVVGISAVYQFPKQREKGIGSMMIYIHQDFHGAGLGSEMTRILLKLARGKGLHRVSLEVVEDNVAAVRLYKKMGFEVEGVMRDAYFGTDQEFHNMLVMGLLFSKN